MADRVYIELKKPSLQDPPGLSILKSKFNRVAILLNGFDNMLSEQQVNDYLTQLKYFQQEMDTYNIF